MQLKKALHTEDSRRYRPAIEAVLAFATLTVESIVQVDRLLSNAGGLFGDDKSFRFTLLDGVLQPFSGGDAASYSRHQRTVASWLKRIVKWPQLRSRDKAAILREIQPWTEQRSVRLRSRVVGDRLIRSYTYEGITVEGIIGEVMFLIFEQGFAESGGIGHCPECESYFLKGRADQILCSNRCRQRQHRRVKGGSSK